MSELVKLQIRKLLSTYHVPYLGTDLYTAGAVKNIEGQDQIIIDLQFGFPMSLASQQTLKDDLTKLLVEFSQILIRISIKIRAHQVQDALKPLTNVKNIIAVGSGKGGVGKSTVSINLALALSEQGARVGILDADIYGPSQPMMLGIVDKPNINHDNKKFMPVSKYGIQSMSIGYLVDEDAPVIWRGPMVSSALQQLLNESLWDNLDYLIVDLPPGTGDIQLTLSQKIPVSAAVIVTTPQDVALSDAIKALQMFQKVAVPVMGVIENMSFHICNACGHQEAIFGEAGGLKIAEKFNLPLLGSLPLKRAIREHSDQGRPIMIAEKEGDIAQQYRNIALKLSAQLSLRPIIYGASMPKINLET